MQSTAACFSSISVGLDLDWLFFSFGLFLFFRRGAFFLSRCQIPYYGAYRVTARKAPDTRLVGCLFAAQSFCVPIGCFYSEAIRIH